MTLSRNSISSLCLIGVLATLGACAAGTSAEGPHATAGTTSSTAATTTTVAGPSTTTTAAAATEAAPRERLTATQINEKCWMRTETNRVSDLDKRMKIVDKCVADLTKAQGGS